VVALRILPLPHTRLMSGSTQILLVWSLIAEVAMRFPIAAAESCCDKREDKELPQRTEHA
jgi:hypothetical protein